MQSYTSPYTTEKNRTLLESISTYGIASAAELHTKGVKLLLSGDTYLNEYVFINAYSSHILKSDLTKTVKNLFHSFQAGTGAFQIAYERNTNYFPRNCSPSQLVSERIHNSLLFMLKPDSILEREKDIQPSHLNGETKLKNSIRITDIQKAFVPSHLIELFKSIFPSIDYVEVETIQEKYSANSQFVEINPLTADEADTCQIPNYEQKIIDHIIKHNDDQPRLFHLVRLTSPSDESIKEIQNEANKFSNLRDLNNFDIGCADSVKQSGKKYSELLKINASLNNPELGSDIKMFECRMVDIILKSSLCKKGSLKKLKEFCGDVVSIYLKIKKHLALQPEDQIKNKITNIFSLIAASKNIAIHDNGYSRLKSFFKDDCTVKEEADCEDINRALNLYQEYSLHRPLRFDWFPEFIKNPDNLAQFHRDLEH